jgi:hypothetical protein
MKDRVRQIGTFVGIIGGIMLDSTRFRGGRLGDSDIGEISDRTNTLITPADGTFAIWSIIFAWTLVFAVHQALPSQRENPLYCRIGWWAAVNGVAGGLWSLAFSNLQFVAAWLLMLVLFGSLLIVSVRIGLGRTTPRDRAYWLAYMPFNINFGWITIATMVNTVQVLQYVVGWDGTPLSAEVWAAVLICAAAGIGVWQVVQLRNVPLGLVVMWALGGVAIAKVGISLVLIPAVLAVVLVASALVLTVYQRRSTPGAASARNEVLSR